MIAVVPVREGLLPPGGEETICEAGGRAVLVGAGALALAGQLTVAAHSMTVWETPGFKPGVWAKALAPYLVDDPLIILPASPDGRDLAPRIAYELNRPLIAGAVQIEPERVVITRHDRRLAQEISVRTPIVTTLQPGVRNVDRRPPCQPEPEVQLLALALSEVSDAELLEVLPPDPATVDLSEAVRIIAGGLGLGDAERFAQLGQVATALDASVGATRAAADVGWAPPDRFIGATGAVVNPDLYVALGVSGAVQHVAGLGQPKHIIAVNLDPGCPMMAMADLAIVSDARALLEELAVRLRPEDRSHD